MFVSCVSLLVEDEDEEEHDGPLVRRWRRCRSVDLKLCLVSGPAGYNYNVGAMFLVFAFYNNNNNNNH